MLNISVSFNILLRLTFSLGSYYVFPVPLVHSYIGELNTPDKSLKNYTKINATDVVCVCLFATFVTKVSVLCLSIDTKAFVCTYSEFI